LLGFTVDNFISTKPKREVLPEDRFVKKYKNDKLRSKVESKKVIKLQQKIKENENLNEKI